MLFLLRDEILQKLRLDTKLYVPAVTLSTENDKKLLEQLRTRFKRTIKWNKYRSEMTNQTKNNNLNYNNPSLLK